ncbi:MAG: argininosuccinate lyase [Burkholderiales bacterium]|nr:argininosuccinate lyase [Burkholderiales bacterium]
MSFSAVSQTTEPRDTFFWLSQINKASTVINSQEGLLDKDLAKKIAGGLTNVIKHGNDPNGYSPDLVITYEPELIKEVGIDATMLHIGRSSQDMLAASNTMILRDYVIDISEALSRTMQILEDLARKNVDTVVPNYTNGVAAQPNTYAHYLYGYLASFERDQQRLRECYERLNYSPMGTTVLNGTSWPLDNARMAHYLAFRNPVSNAYDAAQMKPIDELVEISGIVTSIALHIGTFIQDVMTQYAQPRPWIILQEGGENTYVSSAMPQKRNPGILINTRRDASSVIGEALANIIRAHNLAPGFIDPKGESYWPTLQKTLNLLQSFDKCLLALRINPDRAFEELNLDWTASQEVADYLVREHKLPFRVGHHFASQMVGYARAHDIKPLDFPYAEAQRIYAEVIKKEYPAGNPTLPLTDEQLKSLLNPREIVKNRRTYGGPQPMEMERQLREMQILIKGQEMWATAKKKQINEALDQLDKDFIEVLNGPGSK